MRITALIILVASLHLSAKTIAQKITMSSDNISIEQFFYQLKKQTGYSFLFKEGIVSPDQKININIADANLQTVLELALKPLSLTYRIDNSIVYILKAAVPPIQPVAMAAPTFAEIQGRITDTAGKPLSGVSVMVKSTHKGTSTDANGKFSIAASVGETLVVSSVGFQSVQYKIRSETDVITLSLVPVLDKLDDVVVVGVQSQLKRVTTTSVSSVSGKDIENIPAPSVDVLLQGRVPGLNIQVNSGEPGVAPTMVVRGNTRINTRIGGNSGNYVAQAQAMSSPLYVIDGIPVNTEDIANSIDATGTNYLAGINVNDIENIDVQKDAAAAAAWGSRGANGVIYIKTRKGRSTRPEFRVNVYGGITRQPQLLKTTTGADERREKMSIINQYATPAQLGNLPQLLTDSMNPYFNNATDWQGLFYRNGAVQNVDATMSANGGNVNYRLSMNYYNEKGIIEAFGYTRYSVRGNFDFRISPRLNSQFVFSMSKSDRKRGRKYYNNSDDNTPVSGSSQPSSLYRLTSFDSLNFQGIYNKLRNKNISDLYSASLTTNYTLFPFLKYTFQGAANISTSNRDYFQPSNIDQVALLADNASPQASYAEADKGTYTTYFVSNSLNFAKKLKMANDHAHNIVVTASQQFNADIASNSYVSGYNVPSNDIQVVSGIPQADLSGGSGYARDGLLSFVGQLQYDFDGKYLLYGSYRGDASSRFGRNSKWGYFPAVGAGWIVSEEKFMEPVSNYINFLKLRGSWGVSGSQSGDFYAPYNSYIVPGTYNGAVAIQPSYNNGLTKNDLTWAKTTQKNIAIEAQLLKSKLWFTLELYDKISRDDYYNFQLPFYTGFQSINFNAHDLWVSNRGADIMIGAKILPQKSPLQWSTQLTVSYNKNAIAKLPNNNRTFVITDYYGVSRIFAVGQPIYEMFQLKYGGVYNYQKDIPFNPVTGKAITYFKGNHTVVPGDPIWEDVNKIGDVWVDEDNGNQYGDRVPMGNPNPKFTGGFINDFTYKNFSLSLVSVFTWKRDVVNTFFQQQISNITGGYSSSIYSFASSRLPDLSKLDYWTPQKASAKAGYKAGFPSINPFGPSYYQYIPLSSQFNEDGSYFKIRTVIMGYRLPRTFTQKLKVGSARVYGIIDNFLTFKKSTMPDPESVDQLGIYTGGLYPQPRKFTLGIDIQF
ncbi:SusC/RagA family TonB-linked outer membrane protein [Niastella vici]|nr:SusC/RagA family TonB-linked outer membrane protein [Niastella vici]